MHNDFQQSNDNLDFCVYLESTAALTGNAVCPGALPLFCGPPRNCYLGTYKII